MVHFTHIYYRLNLNNGDFCAIFVGPTRFCEPCRSRMDIDRESTDAVAGTARRGEVAGGCAGQVEPTTKQRSSTSIRYNDSVAVSPRVTRLRETVRYTRQHVTSFERST